MKKILLTYPLPKEGFKAIDAEFSLTYPEKKAVCREELLSCIGSYDGMIACGVRVDKEVLDAAKNLKIISNYGVGYDSIDVDYATGKGIIVANTPHTVTEATAETAFGLMLAVMRRISECDRKLRQDKDFSWGIMSYLGSSLYGKTLGIIGMGRIGQAVARRAVASGMKIVYHNRTRLKEEQEKCINAQYLSLHDLLQASDVISVHAPLSQSSYHLLGEEEFKLIKPSAYIINTARGAVLDEKVLVEYLANGRIAGAGLDVFEKEPIIPAALFTLDNVVLTPHIGTKTLESRIWMGVEASQSILEYFRGQAVQNIVNPEVLANR